MEKYRVEFANGKSNYNYRKFNETIRFENILQIQLLNLECNCDEEERNFRSNVFIR